MIWVRREEASPRVIEKIINLAEIVCNLRQVTGSRLNSVVWYHVDRKSFNFPHEPKHCFYMLFYVLEG